MKSKFNDVISVLERIANGLGCEIKIIGSDTEKWQSATVQVIWSSRDKIDDAYYGFVINEDTLKFNQDGITWSLNAMAVHGNFSNRAKTELSKLSWVDKDKSNLETIDIMANNNKSLKASIVLERIFSRLPLAIQKLQSRHDNRPAFTVKDEYDIQDLLAAMLVIHFEDVRSEDYMPQQAGASSRIDFILKKEKVGIEVKYSKSNLTDKKLGEQLSIDIQRYQSHPDVKTLYFYIYDPDKVIKNRQALINDFSKKHNRLKVQVVIS